MAEGSSPSSAAAAPASSSLKGLREQMVAAAQALADERRNQSGMSASPVPSAITIKSATKPVIDGSILKSEERQRLARERREEREKLNAVKELQILDKERKAKLQYEKQMEEKQRRLREQKLKEQQRRAAVEEKRKQKIVEEKEHYEAVVHRTLERSQRLDTRQKRWSWGGSVTDSDSKTEPPSTAEASKRSTSTANLKQAETVINKRLSSSAALLNSPSKSTTKRSASLNRLNNKAPVNSEQPVPKGVQVEQKESPLCPRSASNSAISSPVHVPKVPVRSRSIDRLKASDPSENVSLESAQKTEGAKSAAGRRAPSPSLSTPRRSPSPANVGKHPSSPAARQKSHPPSPSVLRQRPPSPARVPKPAPIQRPSLTPNVLSITKKKTDTESKPKERAEEAGGKEPGPSSQTSERENAANASKTKEDAGSKAVPGTTTAEEAARILAEKRRLAREQREREDQERVQREEEERIRKEEMAKKALEEQAQLEAALCQLEEERRAEEEEQQKMAEEERIRREQEEQEKLAELLLQREEAEAKAQEEAERQRQERERIMQQNMQERLERKKRIEEIMKRTRKGDQSGAKNDDQSNAEDDGVEEDEELGLEKQDEPEKKNYIDCSLEGSPVVMHSSPLLQDGSKMEPDDVFINGGDQEEVDQRKDGNSVCFTQNIEASPLVKETIIKNSEILHVNEADHPVGFLSNLNGKSSTWSFEEYIDLGVHPKSTRLSSESIADRATQNLKDATTVPTSPKLAFEEESAVNSLIQPIETASVLVVDSCSGR
ncbi:MAP7 domain-containing protein 3 isoform X6 [Hemicordylus capensis]|uniref:MAP7 domain-containing protein 3 isoform X6 n=1 Tax=Hemicordylus capensis TaxID=884348 RepID=UPI002303453B|nr:MAP7 domain-containing protein 3 isoform X6 [Hemicordylus capensis]